jgi:hypothetical protein
MVRPSSSSGSALAFGLSVLHALSWTGVAHADEPDTVPVSVTVQESFSLRGQGALSSVTASCRAPCTVHLIPGEYKYFSGQRQGDLVAFSGPSRLDLHGPSKPLQTTGFVLGGVGLLALAGPLVAIFATCTPQTVEKDGRVTPSRCVSFGEGTDRTLTIIAGGGLALAVFGTILFFTSGGGLHVTDVDPKAAHPSPKLGEKLVQAFSRGALFTF